MKLFKPKTVSVSKTSAKSGSFRVCSFKQTPQFKSLKSHKLNNNNHPKLDASTSRLFSSFRPSPLHQRSNSFFGKNNTYKNNLLNKKTYNPINNNITNQKRDYILLKSKFENRVFDLTPYPKDANLLPEITDAEKYIEQKKQIPQAKILVNRAFEVLKPNLSPEDPTLLALHEREYVLNFYDRNFGKLEECALGALSTIPAESPQQIPFLSRAITSYKFLHKYKEGLGLGHQMVDYFKKKGENAELAEALLQLGNVSYWEEEIFEKVDNTNSLFWQAHDLHDEPFIKARATNNIGCLLLRGGELDRAEEKFKEALFLIDKAQKADPKTDKALTRQLESDRIATELNLVEAKMEGGDHGPEVQGQLELQFKDYVKLVGIENKNTWYHILFLVKMGQCYSNHNENTIADGCFSKAFSLAQELCRYNPLEEHIETMEQICFQGAEVSWKVGKHKGAKLGYAIGEGLKYYRKHTKQNLLSDEKPDLSNLSPEEREERERESAINSFANILKKYFSGELSDDELRERATNMAENYATMEQILKGNRRY